MASSPSASSGLLSSSGEGLHDVQLGVRADGIAERHAVLHLRAIHEDDDMVAQGSVLVQNVASRPLVRGKRGIEGLPNCCAGNRDGRARNVPLKVRREDDPRHVPSDSG